MRLESFLHFDKKIPITRDPRDRVISWILYGLWESPHVGDDLKMSDFAVPFASKGTGPPVGSVIALHAHFLKLLNQPLFPRGLGGRVPASIRRTLLKWRIEFRDCSS